MTNYKLAIFSVPNGTLAMCPFDDIHAIFPEMGKIRLNFNNSNHQHHFIPVML
jgi:hypothetical protein